MPDTDETKEQEEQEDSKQEKQEDSKAENSDEKTSGGGILPWIIMFVVLVLCGGTGFVFGRFFGGSRTPEIAEYSQGEEPPQVGHLEVDEADGSAADSQKAWFYDLEPVVANLNEPNVTRYVRAAITLEINSEVDREKARAFLDEKKPILTNWLTIYLASLGLEGIRGDGNLKRIQLQILDGFNEKLFPDSKPQIKRILFKEFAIQ
jgi:flagellar basal body-associated protein FliL